MLNKLTSSGNGNVDKNCCCRVHTCVHVVHVHVCNLHMHNNQIILFAKLAATVLPARTSMLYSSSALQWHPIGGPHHLEDSVA